MTVEAVFGLLLIPALAGAASGWIYWIVAGRPRAREETPDDAH